MVEVAHRVVRLIDELNTCVWPCQGLGSARHRASLLLDCSWTCAGPWPLQLQGRDASHGRISIWTASPVMLGRSQAFRAVDQRRLTIYALSFAMTALLLNRHLSEASVSWLPPWRWEHGSSIVSADPVGLSCPSSLCVVTGGRVSAFLRLKHRVGRRRVLCSRARWTPRNSTLESRVPAASPLGPHRIGRASDEIATGSLFYASWKRWWRGQAYMNSSPPSPLHPSLAFLPCTKKPGPCLSHSFHFSIISLVVDIISIEALFLSRCIHSLLGGSNTLVTRKRHIN
jgi:hypothetical protein